MIDPVLETLLGKVVSVNHPRSSVEVYQEELQYDEGEGKYFLNKFYNGCRVQLQFDFESVSEIELKRDDEMSAWILLQDKEEELEEEDDWDDEECDCAKKNCPTCNPRKRPRRT